MINTRNKRKAAAFVLAAVRWFPEARCVHGRSRRPERGGITRLAGAQPPEQNDEMQLQRHYLPLEAPQALRQSELSAVDRK